MNFLQMIPNLICNLRFLWGEWQNKRQNKKTENDWATTSQFKCSGEHISKVDQLLAKLDPCGLRKSIFTQRYNKSQCVVEFSKTQNVVIVSASPLFIQRLHQKFIKKHPALIKDVVVFHR